MLLPIRRKSPRSLNSFLNREYISTHTLYLCVPAKLSYIRVGPRRLARSLLLGLHRRTRALSADASESREKKFESGPPVSEPPKGGQTNEEATQARETLDNRRGLHIVLENGVMTSSVSGDADSVGYSSSEDMPSEQKGELEAEKLPFRPGPTLTNGETRPVQADRYKYLLVDDNDINLKVILSQSLPTISHSTTD